MDEETAKVEAAPVGAGRRCVEVLVGAAGILAGWSMALGLAGLGLYGLGRMVAG